MREQFAANVKRQLTTVRTGNVREAGSRLFMSMTRLIFPLFMGRITIIAAVARQWPKLVTTGNLSRTVKAAGGRSFPLVPALLTEVTKRRAGVGPPVEFL